MVKYKDSHAVGTVHVQVCFWKKGNYFGYIRPWYRLPEKAKDTPSSPEGDDNPDILDFMGHGELLLGLRGEQFECSAKLRGNFSTGKGQHSYRRAFQCLAGFAV